MFRLSYFDNEDKIHVEKHKLEELAIESAFMKKHIKLFKINCYEKWGVRKFLIGHRKNSGEMKWFFKERNGDP